MTSRPKNNDPSTSFYLLIRIEEKYVKKPIKKNVCIKINQTHTHVHPPNILVVL